MLKGENWSKIWILTSKSCDCSLSTMFELSESEKWLKFGVWMVQSLSQTMSVKFKSYACHNKPEPMHYTWRKGFFNLSSYKWEKGWPKCTPDPWTHCILKYLNIVVSFPVFNLAGPPADHNLERGFPGRLVVTRYIDTVRNFELCVYGFMPTHSFLRIHLAWFQSAQHRIIFWAQRDEPSVLME